MKRSIMLVATLVVAMAGTAMSQQVVQQPVRVVQPTRSYRSYSVSPTNPPRGDVRRNGPHGGEASWRHAGAKAVGHYSTGR